MSPRTTAMPRFEITRRIHFGYMREAGVTYDDLTDADVANLSAPRDGLPSGYGRRLPDEQVAADVRPPDDVAAMVAEEALHETVLHPDTGSDEQIEPAAARSDAAPEPPRAEAPFHCRKRDCKFGFGRRQFADAVARDKHQAEKNH